MMYPIDVVKLIKMVEALPAEHGYVRKALAIEKIADFVGATPAIVEPVGEPGSTKFEFRARVTARFRLTEAQLNVLAKCADRHYDATCRSANKGPSGGFDRYTHRGCIWGWVRQLEFQHELVDGQRTTQVEATSSELDLCLKIMEYKFVGGTELEFQMQRDLFRAFLSAYRRCNELYDLWQDEGTLP
jgi:hypothetical protein